MNNHQDYLTSSCFSANSEAEQKTRTQPLVLCRDGYEKYSASSGKLFHNILTRKHNMMGQGIKKFCVSFHPPLDVPVPSPTHIKTDSLHKNPITYNSVCHKLYKGLLKPFCVKASNYCVVTLCYVMLLVIYSILFYSIYKVIIYKPYDITSMMLCYVTGYFFLPKTHQKTPQFNKINRQKGGQPTTC